MVCLHASAQSSAYLCLAVAAIRGLHCKIQSLLMLSVKRLLALQGDGRSSHKEPDQASHTHTLTGCSACRMHEVSVSQRIYPR